ncbi:hypothetical protein [Streptomyces phaeochromogenes]
MRRSTVDGPVSTTGVRYTETGSGRTLRIGPASFHRQVTHREWTVKFPRHNIHTPLTLAYN